VEEQAGRAVRIRSARSVDCVELARLAGQLGYGSTASQIAERMAAMEPSADYGVFVAELPTRGIVGWIGVSVLRTLETTAWAEVTGLIVDEAYRSQGIGCALMDRAEQWARLSGHKAIAVHSNVVRERAHRFYEGRGFACLKTQRFLYKDLQSDGRGL